MLKKGDFVKVKAGTTLESGEIVNNWAGIIQQVFRKEKTAFVELDAPTIDSLSDDYLLACIEEGAEPFEYIFSLDELEISTRRDTYEQTLEAIDRLSSRMLVLEGDEEQMFEELKKAWIEAFMSSTYFQAFNELQKEDVHFATDSFMHYSYSYKGVHPKDWSPTNVRSVCLEIIPRKITTDQAFFENFGEILIDFFKFLGSENHITNAGILIRTVENIKDQIPIEASNPNNWGMAKSLMMSAQEQGIDINNEEDINRFMRLQQAKSFDQLGASHPKSTAPLPKDPFKKIGRNQKITVKYLDGSIVEQIKFKKVALDLRNGKCEIIKSK